MLVKFNSRGKGGSAGPVNYLLGKDRDRHLACVLRGNVEQTSALIDSLSFARNYTSGCLSFAESDLPDDLKQMLMDSFEQTIFAGLDRDQWDCLWVEHRDKGRLELNFLIPNVELLSGKRLQPYFDRADRTRINAWQTFINGELDLHDPNDPDNAKAVSIPSRASKDRKETIEVITSTMRKLIDDGMVKDRNDVIAALQQNGFEVTRETKTSISVRDLEMDAKLEEEGKQPRPIRLKGEIYERDFRSGESYAAERERAIREYQRNRKQRVQQAKQTHKKAHRIKCEYNQQKHPRPQPERTAGIEPSTDAQPDGIHAGRDTGRSHPDRDSRPSHSPELDNINNWVKKHERNSEAVGFSFTTITATLRQAIQRIADAIKRPERAGNTDCRRYYQRQQQQHRRQNAPEHRRDFTMR
ncbi:MAG: relaxase/mobilization nuclease domain-containing protein [Paraglaciecola sp.]|nr:relaxase/mobilization nuclease domain-containing protein [Paraglaciecola sp.]